MNTARTSLFLMANLGSEVSRIISAQQKNDHALLIAARERAQNMVSEIKRLPDMKARISEVNALSEAIVHLGETIQPEHLRSYFIPFIERLFASTGIEKS